jgi:ATP-dependent DNA ligase
VTDQLSLDLEAGLPHPPSRLRPMLPRPQHEPFDSAGHLFEPAWGGTRALAFLEPAVADGRDGTLLTVDGGPSVRLIDAGGRDVAARLPELGGLAMRVEARSAVLDGELVVVTGDGRPDPGALADRLAGRPGPAVALLVFDLLYLDGLPLLGRPLTRRREQLRRVLRPDEVVVAVPAIVGEGRALHAAVGRQGLAGVLARDRTSPYLPGVRSRLWRWIAAGPPNATGTGPPSASTGAALRAPAPTATPEDERDDRDRAGDRSAGPGPILAVFRQLPLDIDLAGDGDDAPGDGA